MSLAIANFALGKFDGLLIILEGGNVDFSMIYLICVFILVIIWGDDWGSIFIFNIEILLIYILTFELSNIPHFFCYYPSFGLAFLITRILMWVFYTFLKVAYSLSKFYWPIIKNRSNQASTDNFGFLIIRFLSINQETKSLFLYFLMLQYLIFIFLIVNINYATVNIS